MELDLTVRSTEEVDAVCAAVVKCAFFPLYVFSLSFLSRVGEQQRFIACAWLLKRP